jgi:hypothetical protein
MFLQPLWTLVTFQTLHLYRVGGSPWTGDQPVARHLPINRIKAHKMVFTPGIPVFKREKTVHAFERAANVIGITFFYLSKFK